MPEEKQQDIRQELLGIVNSRLGYMEQFYPLVRDAFKITYDWPEIDPLRHEVCLAIIFGICQAAITLTNHLMESLLKNALIVHQASRSKADDSSGMVAGLIRHLSQGRIDFGKKGLQYNINMACSFGIITKEQKKRLNIFRDRFRNAYSHSDKDSTFGEATIPVQGMRIEGDKIIAGEPEMAKLADLIIGQGIAQAKLAERDAIPYFLEIDALVREVMKRIFTERPAAT